MKRPTLAARMAALQRFTAVTDPHLPDPALAPATALIARAGERLALSSTHTVVALAGSTGTGKSSIFNALAGATLSAPGVRRPTTGEAHACVWGGEPAGTLLDWLGVRRRHQRDGGADPDLSGLVLLDLPDFDSVEAAHRVEADRLLSIVDLVVWVLHPQKYADKLVHRAYLSRFHRHRDITVVLLNQADLLSAEDLAECLTDLRGLLKRDGLDDVPLLTSSTVGPPGLGALTGTLAKAVAARQAALRRLEADLDQVTDDLTPYTAAPPPKDGLPKPAMDALTAALSRAAGVPLVAGATGAAYVHRARQITGWPLLRWLRRLRPDPLRRLRLGDRPATDGPGPPRTGATSIGPAAPAAQAAVTLTLRETADRAAAPLPEPWHAPMLAAVRSRADDLPDALDQAVARTDLGMSRTRWWWHGFGALQWAALAVALAGLLWLAVRYGMFALALPELPLPEIGRLPAPTALLGGGLLAGLLLSLLARPLVRLAAWRQQRRVHRRLHTAVTAVARDLVAAPAEKVLTDYTEAATALRQATGRR